MRIASNTIADGIVRQIQQLSNQQAKLQSQVASGQRISQPEDDPAAVGRVLNLESERRQITQFGDNAANVLAIAQASFAGLQGIIKISDRAGELAILGAGVLGSDAMQAYAAEADQLIEQAVQAANTRFYGNYIYAGTAVDAPAVSAVRNAGGEVTLASYAATSPSPPSRCPRRRVSPPPQMERPIPAWLILSTTWSACGMRSPVATRRPSPPRG